MTKEQRILEEVDKTLHAFDDLPKLGANPYLFTRIKARLTAEAVGSVRNILKGLKLKPVALAIVVILNIITLIHVLETDRGSSSRDQLINALSQDYHSAQSAF